MKLILLICMIFFHTIGDYYLQKGWMSVAKEKEWWEKNAPNPLYRYDYLAVLIIHSISWTFMIMLPIMIICYSKGIYNVYLIIFLFNVLIHAITDNVKANLKKINLIQDQLIHLLQIILTWALSISTICG